MDADLINNIVIYAIAIAAAARLASRVVAKITAITPSTRDDEIVNRAQQWIARVQAVLGTISLPSHGAETTAAKAKAKSGSRSNG